jgi:xanthine/uracil/vitamin C permease (AzgA family)
MANGSLVALADTRSRRRSVFLVDAVWCVLAPVFGLTPTTVFIESIVAIAAGARTGLASSITGLCFLVAIPLRPLIQLMPSAATGAHPHARRSRTAVNHRDRAGVVALFSCVLLSRLLLHIDFRNPGGAASAVLVRPAAPRPACLKFPHPPHTRTQPLFLIPLTYDISYSVALGLFVSSALWYVRSARAPCLRSHEAAFAQVRQPAA